MVKALKLMLESGMVLEFWYDADEVTAERWNIAGYNGTDAVSGRARTLAKAVARLKKVAEDAGFLRLEVDKSAEV